MSLFAQFSSDEILGAGLALAALWYVASEWVTARQQHRRIAQLEGENARLQGEVEFYVRNRRDIASPTRQA